MKICYTLDGSKPTGKSTVYSKPIIIDKTTTMKAILADEAGYVSSVYQKTYGKVKLINSVAAKNTTKEGLCYNYYEGDYDSIPAKPQQTKAYQARNC